MKIETVAKLAKFAVVIAGSIHEDVRNKTFLAPGDPEETIRRRVKFFARLQAIIGRSAKNRAFVQDIVRKCLAETGDLYKIANASKTKA